jgi:glucose/mannose transport system substrate-binding protein
LLFAGALVGCSDSSSTAVRLEVYSWWTESEEARAFELVGNLHESLHPNVEVVNLTDPMATDARTHVAQITLAGAPPDTFQANIGADLLRWTVADTQAPLEPVNAAGSLRPGENRIFGLSRLFERARLSEELPDELLQGLRAGGSLEPYAVPINIHRLNVLYYNVAELARFSPPEGYDSWLAASLFCPGDLKAAPLPFKIAYGPDSKFALTLLVFESLLPAVAGADLYDRLFRGQMPTMSGVDDDWSVVRRVLGCARYLGHSITLTDKGWEGAVDAVTTGDATMTVIGDWAGGQLSFELEHGTVRTVPFPGSEEVYVFTSDTFPLPVHGEHTAEAEALLETIASREAQRIFSAEKGSIPARRDVWLNDVDTKRRSDFDNHRKALATSGLFPPYYQANALHEKLEMMMLGNDDSSAPIDAIIDELVALQPLLRRWQGRLQDGPSNIPLP